MIQNPSLPNTDRKDRCERTTIHTLLFASLFAGVLSLTPPTPILGLELGRLGLETEAQHFSNERFEKKKDTSHLLLSVGL